MKLEFGQGWLLAAGCYLTMIATHIYKERPSEIRALNATKTKDGKNAR
jgi:hypothetical protein